MASKNNPNKNNTDKTDESQSTESKSNQIELTEAQKLLAEELDYLKSENEKLKETIKANLVRIKEIVKGNSQNPESKKDKALKWLTENPDVSLADFLKHTLETLDMSVVYSQKLYKAFKAGK